MNKFIQTIFIKIANKLGLNLVKKKTIVDDYSKIDDISITATIANRLSTITFIDSSISIDGENARAKFVNDVVTKFSNNQISTACEVSLGTGDVILKPNTDGKRIAIDIIDNSQFIVNEAIGDFLKAITIKVDEVEIKDKVYERFEYHEFVEGEQNYCVIRQLVYCNGEAEPLTSVEQWADIQPVIIIPNVDRLLIGRYKCPTIDRSNINNVYGVPITFGHDKVIDNAVEAYNRFNEEFEAKETMLFADKQLFKGPKDNGMPELPKGKERLFVNLRSKSIDSDLGIKEYSPDIRSDSLVTGIEENFKMIELITGLSNGILTKPSTNFATATEMRNSLQQTYANITKIRKVIESGTNDLIYAIDKLANLNNITPMGNFNVQFDWSDSYIEQMSERFNQLLQAESIGAISKAEFRQWVMNEDYNIALERVNEIVQEAPSEVIDII